MNQKQNTFQAYKIWLALALAVVAIAGITLLAIRTSAATDSGGLQIVEERYEGTWGIYNIHRVTLPEDFELERWKYLIRHDDTCSGSTFGNDGKDTEGNLPLRYDEDDEPVYVSYSTDPDIEYIPFNTSSYEEASTFDGKYVCFAVRAQDGRWPVIGAQLNIDWTPRTGGPGDVDDGDCPDGYEWHEAPDGESGCLAETSEDVDDQPAADTDRIISDSIVWWPHADRVVWEDDDTVTADFIAIGSDEITSVGYGLPDDRVESCDDDTEYNDRSDSTLGTIARGFTESGNTYKNCQTSVEYQSRERHFRRDRHLFPDQI